MLVHASFIRVLIISAVTTFNGWSQVIQKHPESADKVTDTSFVQIESKSGCFDACPIYGVRIQANGTVTWNGKQGVQTPGLASRHVSAQAARSLIETYRAKDFSDLRSQVGGGDDGPVLTTTVHIGEREESINGIPDRKLFRAIGELADTYSWIHGEPRLEVIDGPMLHDSDFAPKPGVTDLMRAASRGDVAGVESELKAGSIVNARDTSGFTAVMYASWTPNREVLNRLLRAGADPNIRSNWGQTAIMAATTGWPAPLENVQILAASGAGLNVQDPNGLSALMVAVGAPLSGRPRRAVNPELILLLLKAGARRDLLDGMGHNAADIAASTSRQVDGESEMFKTIYIPNRAERQAALENERDQLLQVRKLLVAP